LSQSDLPGIESLENFTRISPLGHHAKALPLSRPFGLDRDALALLKGKRGANQHGGQIVESDQHRSRRGARRRRLDDTRQKLTYR
jgi:hypothetical protein